MKSSWEKQQCLQQWNLTLKEAQVSNNYKSSLKKNATNETKTTVCLSKSTTNSKNHLYNRHKKSKARGQGGASNKKKLYPTTDRKAQSQRGQSTLKRRTQPQGSRQPNPQKGNADDTTNVISNEHGRNSMRHRCSRSQPKKKLPPLTGTSRDYSPEQNNTTIWIRH